MKSFEYTITDPVGIHARPAGILVKEIKKYASTVTVIKGEKSVNALKLMALMGMGIKQGDTVKVTVEGADEDTAAAAIEEFFKANLYYDHGQTAACMTAVCFTLKEGQQ